MSPTLRENALAKISANSNPLANIVLPNSQGPGWDIVYAIWSVLCQDSDNFLQGQSGHVHLYVN